MTSTEFHARLELLSKQQHLDKLRDFALNHLYDDVDTPETMPLDRDALFCAILAEARVGVCATDADQIVETVKASRRDLARANTAFEHMRGLLRGYHHLTIGEMEVSVGQDAMDSIDVTAYVDSLWFKMRMLYSEHFARVVWGCDGTASESDEDEHDEDFAYHSEASEADTCKEDVESGEESGEESESE